MTLRAPEPLAAQHRLEGFDCGKPALNDWLLRHARQAQGSGSAKTFVVAEDDGRVAGYFSLTVGQVLMTRWRSNTSTIRAKSASERDRRSIL